jgi:DNA-binding MarR family transcriptional regulator
MASSGAEKSRALDDLLELAATWSGVSRVLEKALSDIGITLPQALALLAIEAAPQSLLLSRLAARLMQEPQSITSLMDRLEKAGWAERTPDSVDRRAIRVGLTAAGSVKVEEVNRVLTAAAEKVMALVDETVQAGLRTGVVALYEACRRQPESRLPALPGRDGSTARPDGA